MAIKRPSGSRSEVVRCPNCGEDYSVTYKRCPFCDERNLPQEEYDYQPEDTLIDGESNEGGAPVRKGGKHVAGSQRRGGGYGGGNWGVVRIVGTVFSLGLIVAAVWIVFNVISPMVGRSNIEATPSVPPTTSVATPAVTPTDGLPASSGAPTPPSVTNSPPVATPAVTPAVTPPATSPAPAGNLKLSREDFTMKTAGEVYTFTVTGASGAVTYQSDKPEVASVDANGKVTAVGQGLANITVTDASGAVAKCIVRCNLSGGASAPVGGDAKLSREDFTLSKAGEKYKITVIGASGTPVWSIGNASVATISGDGTVTAVATGMTTVTCTVDGQTLTCIVRCDW